MEAVLPRNARIDLLRGIAVALVMLLHFSLTYRLPDSWLGDLITPKNVARLVMNGNYGVTMFFVISGFLITTNSLRRWGSLQQVDRSAFYRRRAERILPPLIIAVVVILALGLFDQPSFVNKQKGVVMEPGFWWIAIGSVLTFWHNVLMQAEGYFNYALNIYWSLSVEEVFYLAFPLLSSLLPKRIFLGLCALLVIAGPIYRALHVQEELDYLYGYLACFDAIALGCLAAFLAPRVRPSFPWRSGITVLAALALCIVYLSGIGGHEVFGFTGIAISTGVLLLTGTSEGAQSTVTGWRQMIRWPGAAIRWMGRHSYEIYLFHIIVLGVIRDQLGRNDLQRAWKWPLLVGFFLLSCGVAAVLARVVSSKWMRALWIQKR
ncbi:MAG: acyltransferase [Flavobacteriales bacterium]